MRQKLDIADVEARTKIRAKYLRALENEEWGALPGHTFVKTFLRTYAEVLGVDAHLLVEEYRTSHEVADEELETQPFAGQQPPARGDRPRRGPPGPPSRGAVAVGVVVVLVGFLLVLGLVSGDDEPQSERAGTETTETQTARRAPPQPRPRRRRPAPPAGVTVRIEPTTPTYACIDTGAGMNVVFEGILQGPRTFKNPNRLRLNLGKRALTLRLNGKPVPVAPSPEPVGFDMTRTGAKEIPEGTRPCA